MTEDIGLFALDERQMIVKVGDIILYLDKDNEVNCRKVWDIRCIKGNWEVKVAGENGGWKKPFWKLAVK